MNLDPAITLFGHRIQVEDSPCDNYNEHHGIQVVKEVTEEEPMENDEPDNSTEDVMDESINTPELSKTTDDSEKVIDCKKDSDLEKDEKESGETKEQLKKPDKILPCPRCKSMDTKFCYYNNYNVNQPRHFCKACQRYWTAGGTMRNVPVGAGRRKSKNSAARFCQITVSEDGVHRPGIKTLSFGADNQGVENMDDRSSGSTVTALSMDEQSKTTRSEANPHFNGFANPMQCFPGPYMWHPAVPFCPTVYPMPIFHHPYWNGSPVPWNVPWVPNPSSPTAPTLGKHTRDGEIITPSMNTSSSSSTSTNTNTTTSTILTPKTLRIDDPNEAAKSSIWTTLGIRKDKGDCISKGFFNSLQSKEVDKKKDGEVEVSAAFKANPVALCRSVDFQERA